MTRRLLALLLGGVAAAAPAATARAAAASQAPLDAYPQPAAQPLDDSRPPLFLDDDETVQAGLNPDGSVAGLEDIVLLRMRGSGDYVIVLPGRATAVRNLGGDTPPSLQDGHVSFLGSIFGPGQLGAQATLDPSAARLVPLSVAVRYSAAGKEVAPGSLGAVRGPVTVHISVTNQTAVTRQFISGNAEPGALAAVLDALRQAPATYTPETDMQAALPVPATLPVTSPQTTVSQEVLVPFSLSVTTRLPATAQVGDPGGGDARTDARGTTISWSDFSPRSPGGASTSDFTFTFSDPRPRVPAIDIRADPLPMPAALFTAPGGEGWRTYLATRADRTAATVLAQAGMAALHRIGDLRLPLDRPGPGPEKVRYHFILDSGAAAPRVSAPPPPVRAQPWAVLLAGVVLCAACAGAYAAWSRL